MLHKKGHVAELIYAPDGRRYESILDSTTTEYYVAGGAFRMLVKGGVTTWREAVGGVTVARTTRRSVHSLRVPEDLTAFPEIFQAARRVVCLARARV